MENEKKILIEKELTKEGEPNKERLLPKKPNIIRCTYADCDKSYDMHSKLQTHLRTHTGEKPFKCPFYKCYKAFNEKGNLKTHMRIHTGEKPFKCLVCGRAFKASGHLSDHHRTHTKDKPYQCDICQRFFSRRTVLKEHIKNIHSLEPENLHVNQIDIKEEEYHLKDKNHCEEFLKMSDNDIIINEEKKNRNDDSCHLKINDREDENFCGDENLGVGENKLEFPQTPNNYKETSNQNFQTIFNIPPSHSIYENPEQLINFSKTKTNLINVIDSIIPENSNSIESHKVENLQIEQIKEEKNSPKTLNENLNFFENDLCKNLNDKTEFSDVIKFVTPNLMNSKINLNLEKFFNFNINNYWSNDSSDNQKLNIRSSIFRKSKNSNHLHNIDNFNNDNNYERKSNVNNIFRFEPLPTFEEYLKSFDKYNNIKSREQKESQISENSIEWYKSLNSKLNCFETKSTCFNSQNNNKNDIDYYKLPFFDISKFE